MTQSQIVKLSHAGADLESYLAIPDGAGPHPAVLVMHNAHGLSERMRHVARQLAQSGYLALATDMYGGGKHYPEPKDAGVALGPLWADPTLLRGRVVALFEQLRARPEADKNRVGGIGYCLGGQCVLELARSGADAKVVVSYHGLLTTALPAAPGAVKAHVAVYTGAKDPYAPRAEVEAFQDEMLAAKAKWQITVFGEARHSFTDPDALHSGSAEDMGYDLLSDRVSWAGTEALLDILVKNHA
jgi:dienelactone hydrolase